MAVAGGQRERDLVARLLGSTEHEVDDLANRLDAGDLPDWPSGDVLGWGVEHASGFVVDQHDPLRRVDGDDSFDHALENRQELATLSADGVDSRTQIFGHGVEGSAELADLIGPHGFDAPLMVAGHHGLHDARHGPQPLSQPTRDDEPDQASQRSDRQDSQRQLCLGAGDPRGNVGSGARRSRVAEPLPIPLDHQRAVHHGLAQRCAEAFGRAEVGALLSGQDFGARAVVVHRQRVLARVGEHRAVVVNHGEASAGLFAETDDPLLKGGVHLPFAKRR